LTLKAIGKANEGLNHYNQQLNRLSKDTENQILIVLIINRIIAMGNEVSTGKSDGVQGPDNSGSRRNDSC
jgi:hypothetical protein